MPSPDLAAASEQAAAEDYQIVETSAADQEEQEVMLAVPAAPIESLAQAPRRPPAGARRNLLVKTRAMKQTFIPILLTTSLFSLIGACLKFIMGKDSPVHDFPAYIPITLAVLGLGLSAVAVLNMLSVKAMLAAELEQSDQ